MDTAIAHVPTSWAATPGHNNPPAPTPFELSECEIGDLYQEAKNWLDGEPVETERQATALDKLRGDLRAAMQRAEGRRKDEAKPFDDGKAEVQARYNTLIGDTKTVRGKAVVALELCGKALAPYLRKVELENARKAEAARKEAEEKARIAREAFLASQATDLAAREQAEALAADAKAAEKAATEAENAKAHVKGGARATGLRTQTTVAVSDANAFAKYVWVNHREDLDEFLLSLARRLVAAKVGNLPGVTVDVERVL